MRKYYYMLVFLWLPFSVNQAVAQVTSFINYGNIEFERRWNIHIMFDKNSTNYTELTKSTPQFKVDYFNLFFDHDILLYKPGRENSESKSFPLPAEENVVYSDLVKGLFSSQKKIFDKTFLIKDSIRRINWKITNEKREIAGFECTRANAIILDSIYVVAFYTDRIIPRGGPESFTGLPGMILGVTLPHVHVSWFATSVDTQPIKKTDITPPVKGIPQTLTSIQQLLRENLANWGRAANRYIQAIML